MTFKQYLIFLILCTGAAWGVWAWVLHALSPDALGLVAVVLFYVSLGLAVMGTLSLLGLLIRVSVLKSHELRFATVSVSFRQALLLTLLFIATLAFERLHYLTLWTFVILILFIMSVELFFSSGSSR